MKNFAKKCECGAVTVTYVNDDMDEITVSMTESDYLKHFLSIDLESDTYGCCDYCVNHWGIDLCGSGSGEKIGECENDFDECRNNIPSQTIDEPSNRKLWN